MKRLVERYYELLSRTKDGHIRSFALANGILFHVLAVLVLLFFQYYSPSAPPVQPAIEELGGLGGGGGGGEEKEITIEFGPSSGDDAEEDLPVKKTKVLQLLNLQIIRPIPVEEAPPPKKEEAKPKKKVGRKGPKIAYVPQRRIRGVGPGSGGGYGTGSGGGIGAGTGYSIDWGGTGSRRLLSAKLPSYPPGTDKEMAVVLSFVVLPDGSVSEIRPASRSDQILERAAISALSTWRFEALPPQLGEKLQRGSIKFNFKFER
jgi:TonB family protein